MAMNHTISANIKSPKEIPKTSLLIAYKLREAPTCPKTIGTKILSYIFFKNVHGLCSCQTKWLKYPNEKAAMNLVWGNLAKVEMTSIARPTSKTQVPFKNFKYLSGLFKSLNTHPQVPKNSPRPTPVAN